MKYWWIIGVILPLLTACVSSRELTYMNEGTFPESVTIAHDILSPGDELFIRVEALDERTVGLFNASAVGEANYRIDMDGTIAVPSIGKIHLAGLSQFQAQDTLAALISQRVKEPRVFLKRVHAYITILGEVKNPGRYELDREVTLLEALGRAGDLTTNGNRQNIQVIRLENGHTHSWTINLHDRNIFLSPAFALKKGDVIYVSPRFGRYYK